MTQFYLITAPVLLLMLALGAQASEAKPEDLSDAPERKETQVEYEARVQSTLRSLTEAQAAGNQVRSFTFKVVDQMGMPVEGALIGGFAKRFLRVMLPSGKMFDGIDIRAVTDEKGMVKTKPTEGAIFELSIYERELPPGYDADTTESITIEGGKPSDYDLRKNAIKPRQAPGIDWIFYVHRFVGPRALLKKSADIELANLDGNVYPWTVLHPLYAHPVWIKEIEGPVDEVVSPIADFRVRYWRDRKAELTVPGGETPLMNGTLPRLINDEASWWFEITCVRGGLCFAGKRLVAEAGIAEVMAPESGYQDRVSWESNEGSDKLSQAKKLGQAQTVVSHCHPTG